MSDKYDEAVEYLTQHPEKIYSVWVFPHGHTHGCLFQFAQQDTLQGNCGCLTTIKSGSDIAETPELTLAIRNDERIPKSAFAITVDNLHVFAEWQRRIDNELGRVEATFHLPTL